MENLNIVYLSEFSDGENDLKNFRKALAYLKNNPFTKLVVEAGSYVFHDALAHKTQQDVMEGRLGNDPEKVMFTPGFDYTVGLDFSGIEGAEISAYGAKILVDGFMEPISLQRCKNIAIEGLTIDHVRKPYSKGIVAGFGDGYTDLDFGNQTMVCEKMPSPRIVAYSTSENRFTELYGSEKKEFVGKNLRFYGFSHKTPRDELYVINTFHSRPAIFIYEAENIHITDVTIHSQPGMGVVGHRSKNIYLSGLFVVPSVGEAYSTNTDATHFASCQGELFIQNCQFDGHGDDAANVHTYYQTISQAKENTCVLTVMAPTGTHSQKLDYPNEGDILELSSADDLACIDTFSVLKAVPDFEKRCCAVTLDKMLPKGCEGFYLANVTQLPFLSFCNNTVRNHLARSVLVKTRNAEIINNAIYENTGTAIHVAAEGYWHEGVSAQNVLIAHNRIIRTGGLGHGRIYDAGGISINVLAKSPSKPVHKNITITDNIIDCPDTLHAIYAANVDGLKIAGNSLRSAEKEVVIENCINVNLSTQADV